MRFAPILFTALLAACTSSVELKPGTWRGVIELQNHELPFQFEVEKRPQGYQVQLRNAGEKITLDEITVKGDSVNMVLHIFDASLKAKIEGDRLSGVFYKNYAPEASLPFHAEFGKSYRFAETAASSVDFSGTYQIEFATEKDTYPSVGVFEQKENHVTGTFLTPTGDYRYLEGEVIDGQLNLSTFDGNHAFVFTAKRNGDSIRGDYYSGKAAHETWRGVRNINAVMPDADTLTLLKPGYETLSFSFPGLDGKPVSLKDEKYKGKVVVLQIFGTWCPNCMDETKFLTKWYKQNRDKGIEVLGLAYERKPDFDYASSRVRKMKEKFGVGYDFVIAGVNDKEKAAETLPELNHVLAFPTTIFIGKDGKVKRIHTGFSGPGTGIYYEQFVQRFNERIQSLLTESN